MKVTRLALTLGLIALLLVPCVADTDGKKGTMEGPTCGVNADVGVMDEALSQQAFNATVQPGPRVKAGLPLSADVYVNGALAIRIPASAAGLTPMQRAEIVANRLNVAFAGGKSWLDSQVLAKDGLWTFSIGDDLIATADANSARAFNTQTGDLAGMWARQTVIALGGEPQMIAAQIMPTTAIAGSMQELGGAAWMVAPIKTVPSLNVSSRESVGSITVGGTQSSLDRVTSVAVYAYAKNNANIWLFVPTTTNSITGSMVPRVTAVGVIRVPSELLPLQDILMGDEATGAMNVLTPTQWNTSINEQMAAWKVTLQGSTKVVPLYSMQMNHVIGAAQVVGDVGGLTQTQAVIASDANGVTSFGATSVAPGMISGQPSMLSSVVVSALIFYPTGGMTSPETTETPETTEMMDMMEME